MNERIVRKIDSLQFARFMQAMEKLAKELDRLQEEEVAGQIAMNGSELETVYRTCRQLKRQLEENVELYFDTFDRAYVHYRQAHKQNSMMKTQAREAAKQLERKQAAKR